MAASKFTFEELPLNVRLRIYGFLGYPISDTFSISTGTNARCNSTIPLRHLYKVDLTADGKLSIPWNYEKNDRNKRMNPKVSTNMMAANSTLHDELCALLYGQSLFLVHTINKKKPKMATLSDAALTHITHLLICFNATDATKQALNVNTYQDALCKLVAASHPLVPNLRYFGINFWSFQLEPMFQQDGTSKSRRIEGGEERKGHDLRDTDFLSRTLLDFIGAHATIETFALLRNMSARGQLNWSRKNRDTAKKALSRDLRRCMAKVYT